MGNVVSNMDNYSTNVLYPLVFQKGSLTTLKSVGLLGVYIDDYGSRKKYRSCIFFHFKLKNEFLKNSKNGVSIEGFMESIVEFKSFYDFYETDEGLMVVFKYNPMFSRDIQNFREGKFSNFSSMFLHQVNNEYVGDVEMDISKEIYRYEK
jgi:hypothetical protein